MKKVIFFFVVTILLSCQNEEVATPNIDTELQPYVERFYSEAESRGIFLDKDLDALMSSEIRTCGEGDSPEFNGRFDKPTILISESCWATYSDIAKEFLVFHELGHALLNRIHIDGILSNGHSKSIMCAGNNFSCSDSPNYSYCPEYRTYYLDELFDQNTSLPQWSIRNWEVVANIHSELNSVFSTDWQVFTNCPANSFQVTIDSISPNRPSPYSLRLFSDCNDFLTIRKRMAIDNALSAKAIRLNFDLYHHLVGDGLRVGLFVKDKDNTFISFNRSVPKAIVDAGNSIDDFTVQAECISADADSIIVDFLYRTNTSGEVLIGNLDVELMD